MATHNHEAWTEVFSGAAFEAEVKRGLLEANGIHCIVEDHTMSAITSSYLGVGGDVRILVSPADADEAQRLVGYKD